MRHCLVICRIEFFGLSLTLRNSLRRFIRLVLPDRITQKIKVSMDVCQHPIIILTINNTGFLWMQLQTALVKTLLHVSFDKSRLFFRLTVQNRIIRICFKRYSGIISQHFSGHKTAKTPTWQLSTLPNHPFHISDNTCQSCAFYQRPRQTQAHPTRCWFQGHSRSPTPV